MSKEMVDLDKYSEAMAKALWEEFYIYSPISFWIMLLGVFYLGYMFSDEYLFSRMWDKVRGWGRDEL